MHVNGTARITTGNEGLNKVLASDATGNADWVTINQNPQIGFKANSTSTTAINSGNLIFATTEYNDGSGYDGTSSFTAPSAGVYHFDAAIRGTVAGTGRVNMCFRKNNSSFEGCTTVDVSAASAAWTAIDNSTDIKLAVGDVINVYYEPIAGTVTPIGISYFVYFSGHKVY